MTPAGIVVCRVDGDIDEETCTRLEEAFGRAAAEAATAVVVDCSHLGYASTVLLNALLRLRRTARTRDLSLFLEAPGPGLLRLLDLTGTGAFLPSSPTVAGAHSAVPRSRRASLRGTAAP
ncbi:STAS domain-containing protein [Streptomyces sp. NPDC097619]|uniref:STAS domain-containing protein n=1 Tax=Streptomyces sp. NPDC097619 TaxID=3157228 RepID=UPI00331CAD9B